MPTDIEPEAEKREKKAAFQMPVENAEALKRKLMVRQRGAPEPDVYAPAEIVSGTAAPAERARNGSGGAQAPQTPQFDSLQVKSGKEAGESSEPPRRRIVLFVTPAPQPAVEP